MYPRTLPMLLCLLVLECIGCAHPSRPTARGSISPSTLTRNTIDQITRPKRVAMVVGINHYEDATFAPLHYAQTDAMAIAEALKDPKAGAFDRVLLRVTPAETQRQTLLNTLQSALEGLGPFDTFILYFSGHGSLELSPPISASIAKGEGKSNPSPKGNSSTSSTPGPGRRFHLVAQDSQLETLNQTGISLDDLRGMVRRSRAGRTAIILDSCFSGQGKSEVTASARQALKEKILDTAHPTEQTSSSALLLAAHLGGSAYEDPTLGHGIYTHYLLKALSEDLKWADTNGDQAVSAWEAHDYARSKTVEHATALSGPEGAPLEQLPEAFLHVVGVQEVYLSGKPDPTLTTAAALIYAYDARAGREAWEVQVDGVAKGAFPRAVPVSPGSHAVVVRDGKGKVQAKGTLRFGSGQIYSVGLLTEELQGYRRLLGAHLMGTQQLMGDGSLLWGEHLGGLTLLSGYRIRGGWFRGLTLTGELGWQGSGQGEASGEGLRSTLSANAAAQLRRTLGQLELGAGAFVGGQVTFSTALPGASPECVGGDTLACSWYTFPAGPLFWQGIRLDRQMMLTFEQRLPLFNFYGLGAGEGQSTRNAQLQLRAGLELGF